MDPELRRRLREIEMQKTLLAFGLAIAHYLDLDGLGKLYDRAASPQTLIGGGSPSMVLGAADWLNVIEATRSLRDAAPMDDDVLGRLPMLADALFGAAVDMTVDEYGL